MVDDTIPFIDFGGQDQTLHFAHANAYTAGCYHQLAAQLIPHFHVLGMQQRPLWAGSRPEALHDWSDMTVDIARFAEQQKLEGVIGMGHSMGCVVSMYAAIQYPHLFDKLVLIDPVFLPPEFLTFLWNEDGKHSGGSPPMAIGARRRRDRWPDRQAAFDHLRPKRAFAGLSDQALTDFVDYGLVADGSEVVLAYPKEWEARIYERLPQALWERIPEVKQPMMILYAEHSNVLNEERIERVRQIRPETHIVELKDSGHLLPMEKPAEVARLILDWLL